MGIEFPMASDATTPLTITGTLELAVPAEIVNVAEATAPFGTIIALSPKSKQVVEPAELEHDKLFDAAVTAADAAIVTPVTSAAE
jgi:hypothetical protein